MGGRYGEVVTSRRTCRGDDNRSVPEEGRVSIEGKIAGGEEPAVNPLDKGGAQHHLQHTRTQRVRAEEG